MKIKLSVDEYAVLRYINKGFFASFDDIVEYLYIYRDKAETLINNLLSKQLIEKEKYTNATPIAYELEHYHFKSLISIREIKARTKTPYLWRLRRIFLKTSRKIVRAISIKKDMIDMYRKNKQRIKKAGLKKEKAEQKRWVKRVLKTKNLDSIILAIKSKGFAVDKEQTNNKCLLWDILFNGTFIIAGKDNDWAIEINSNLPNLEQYEYLQLYTPRGKTYYFVREIS